MACETQNEELLAMRSIFCIDDDTFEHDDETGIGVLKVVPELSKESVIKVIWSSDNPPDAESSSAMTMKTCKVKYLPPICVHYKLPKGYPESGSPEILSIESCWINPEDAEKLKSTLMSQWTSQEGEVVLYSWHQTIQMGALEILNVKDEIRIVCLETFFTIRDHDQNLKSQRFDICCICFEELSGTQFHVLFECQHSFCKSCLGQHCQSKIVDGLMTNVSCPDLDCKGMVDPHIVKDLVDSKQYSMYDQALLNKAIRSMSHTVWCPRLDCQHPAQSFEDKNLGQCPVCAFSFCLKCQKAYHGTNNCIEEEEEVDRDPWKTPKDVEHVTRILQKYGPTHAVYHVNKFVFSMFSSLDKNEMRVLKRSYRSGLPEEYREELYAQYGKAYLEYFCEGNYHAGGVSKLLYDLSQEHRKDLGSMAKLFAELGTAGDIRPCPTCRVPIQKNGGCHHMKCTNCGGNYCWDCFQPMKACTETKCLGKYG